MLFECLFSYTNTFEFSVCADCSFLSKSLQELVYLSLPPRWQNFAIWWSNSVSRYVLFCPFKIYTAYKFTCLGASLTWICIFFINTSQTWYLHILLELLECQSTLHALIQINDLLCGLFTFIAFGISYFSKK